MLNSFIQKLTLLALALGLGFLVDCAGPEGPAGVNGTNGSNGTAPCEACHSGTNADFNLKWNQYGLSLHGTGTIYAEEAGKPTTCGGCHNGDGFAEACALGQNDAVTAATEPINCKACHFIHNKYDSTDFNRRWTTAITFRQPASPTTTQDFNGSGNLCAKCHQLRPITRTQTTFNGVVCDTFARTSTTSRITHHGMAANMETGFGIPTFTGFDASKITASSHINLPKGCVSCHMNTDLGINNTGATKDVPNPASGGHTFKMVTASLANIDSNYFKTTCSCHPASALAAKTKPISTAMASDISKLWTKLISLSLIDTTGEIVYSGGTTTTDVLAESLKLSKAGIVGFGTDTVHVMSSDTVNALINYFLVRQDRSNGAHNPAMMQAQVSALKTFFGVQ